jgi:hypothetical protein
MSPYATYIPLDEVVSWWPDHLFGNPDLTRVAITAYQLEQAASRATAHLGLAFGGGDDIVISIAGIDGFEFVLPPAALSIDVEYSGAFELRASGFDAGLRITSSLLVPVAGVHPDWVPLVDENGQPEPLEMTLQIGQLVIDADFCPTFAVTNALTLPPFMLGSSGIVVEASGVTLYLSGKEIPPSGQPEGFRGVSLDQVTVYLPPSFDLPNIAPDSITARGLVIGHGGVSGSFSAAWQNGWEGMTPAGDGAGTLLGLPFALNSVGVAIAQNALTSAVFSGEIGVPFLDTVLGVEVALDSAGALTIGLSQADADVLTIDVPNRGSLTISSLAFVDGAEGAGVVVNGSLLPSVLSPAVQWPSIELSGLRIGADGSIQLPGGWLDLQTPVALDLYGFRLEISRIGFGNTDDGLRWVGYSAGVHLIDFLPTGVSVEGLRVTWDPAGGLPRVTLQGVGLELTLPGVLTLDGDVSFVNEDVERYFSGNARLALLPLGITLDASIKVGRNLEEDYKFVYTFIGVTLPVGLPLWATGAALYGISGLYGMNVNPSAQGGDWYGWYAGAPSPLDVTHTGKWIGTADGKALGAGLTLGTLFDLGRVVSVKGLFALVLPGPVMMLNGKASFLQLPPNNDDPSSEGVLDALAVLDGRAGTLQLDIDAGWNLGQVIDIAASAEAFFDFANARNWHFWLGQDQPEDRRIRAYLLGLLHGDAYLMIDSSGIATGAGISWGYDWRFGPVTVVLRAWIGAAADITWVPPQLEGRLDLGGEFEIGAAGFDAGLAAEAILSGKAPTLYWVRGELDVALKLPWPLKDLEEDIVLEWRQDLAPPIEPARCTIAVEHLKVDETWTGLPAAEQDTPDEAGYLAGPVVPLDARPTISFDRGMKDLTGRDTFISVDAYSGGTKVGDYIFDYELLEVALDKWSKAGSTAWTPVDEVYGAWMAVEDGYGEPAFTRLQVWARSPFAFTRQTSRTYRDAFLANHASWPCLPPPEIVTHCVDWEGVKAGAKLGPAFERDGLSFTLLFSNAAEVVETAANNPCGTSHALRIEDGSLISLWIVFPEPVHTVELCITGTYLAARAFANGVVVSEVLRPEEGSLGFQATGIDSIALWTSDNCEVARICYQTEALVSEYVNTYEHNVSVYDGLKRWDSVEEILEPETCYRLTVRHQTARTHNGSRDTTGYTDYAYFQTAGPPGLSPDWAIGSAPVSTNGAALPFPYGGKLASFEPYIAATIPADGAVPVYGGYDLGAEFNENYVEQMVGADMAIRLTDANARPVLDAEGREIVFANEWAAQPVGELSETEYAYTTRAAACTSSTVEVAADQKVNFTCSVLSEDGGSALTPQTQYRAELQASFPLLAAGLTASGWIDPSYAWLVLTRDNARVAVIGQETWAGYRVEVNAQALGRQIGLVACFTLDQGAGTFTCDRLLVNLNLQTVQLARVSGSVSGSSFTMDEAGPIVIWSSSGPSSNVDFTLSTHDLALTCAGELIVEIDGVEIDRRPNTAGLTAGKAGLFYLGADEPVFSELVIRSAPRGTVHDWSFVTSRYASFVEHLGSFAGPVHRETAPGVDAVAVADAVGTAIPDLDAATTALTDARALLASAGPADLVACRDAARAAGLPLRTTMAAHFDVVYALLFGASYRPLPPLVELSEVMRGARRLAFLVESPEPLDWSRLSWLLRKEGTTQGVYAAVANAVLLVSDDGARAIVTNRAARVPDGAYELELTYALDVGLEAPVLRRGGSTLPEIARLRFSVA